MNSIIHQIALDLEKEILEKVFIEGIVNIDDMSEAAMVSCKTAAVRITEEIVTMINETIRHDKAGRKELGLTIKEKNRERQYITEIGEINFKYDYMYDSINNCYSSPIFSILGIENNERVSRGLKARLVSQAAFMPYARSVETVADSLVSKQTVCQAIKDTDVEETAKEETEKRKCEELHIYADEDHIKLQREKGITERDSSDTGKTTVRKKKKTQMIPLVVVTEGIEDIGKNRRKTKNPKRLVVSDFNTKRLWKITDGYIEAHYDISSIKKIYIHGDGGRWIKSGLDMFANTIPVMDGFHIEKELTGINNAFPDIDVKSRVRKAVRANNIADVMILVQEMYDQCTTKKMTEKVDRFWTYIRNNWESIRNRERLDIPGSCTEGQVSHILADRFSSRPLGWSLKGAGNLSGIRVYELNGGKITKDNIKAKHRTGISYADYAQKVFDDNLKGSFDFSIFEKSADERNMSDSSLKTISRLGDCMSLVI